MLWLTVQLTRLQLALLRRDAIVAGFPVSAVASGQVAQLQPRVGFVRRFACRNLGGWANDAARVASGLDAQNVGPYQSCGCGIRRHVIRGIGIISRYLPVLTVHRNPPLAVKMA